MDYDKLIERLHKEAYRSDIDDLLLDAATALSTLQAENEKLRTRNTKLEDTVRSQRNGLQELRDQLEAYRNGHCAEGGCAAEKDRDTVLADLARVTAERDAAVALVHEWEQYGRYLSPMGFTVPPNWRED